MDEIRGRCLTFSENQIQVRSREGVHSVLVERLPGDLSVGDIISIHHGTVEILTRNSSRTQSTKFMQRILDPRRLRATATRARVEAGIRTFFESANFIETRTPMLVCSPGMETHIRPYKLATGEYLPTSPEFALKRLLVGGLEKIFQICPAFRYEPFSPHHSPEFTILEWYRAYAGFNEIMVDMENLVETLALDFFGRPEITFKNKKILVKTPWPRLRVRDLFKEMSGVDLVRSADLPSMRREIERLGLRWDTTDTWDDLYFKIWLDLIEPNLPQDKAVFVTHYPASQSALAVIETEEDGSRWARRFEPYAGGLELGNAFEELTDPLEQRKRFIEDMNERERTYGASFPKSPIDEDFLAALEEGMPPSGGIAVGVDRLVMLFADEPDIDYTMWFKPFIHFDSVKE